MRDAEQPRERYGGASDDDARWARGPVRRYRSVSRDAKVSARGARRVGATRPARATTDNVAGGRGDEIEVVSAGAILVPHPDKADKGGEDACFVLKRKGAFGVFDGVGGWAEEGVDPAEYSEQFAERSAQSVLNGERDPVKVMKEAHEKTQVIGSCTACITVLKDGNVLDIANLGDARSDDGARKGRRFSAQNRSSTSSTFRISSAG